MIYRTVPTGASFTFLMTGNPLTFLGPMKIQSYKSTYPKGVLFRSC